MVIGRCKIAEADINRNGERSRRKVSSGPHDAIVLVVHMLWKRKTL